MTLADSDLILLQSGEILNPKYYSNLWASYFESLFKLNVCVTVRIQWEEINFIFRAWLTVQWLSDRQTDRALPISEQFHCTLAIKTVSFCVCAAVNKCTQCNSCTALLPKTGLDSNPKQKNFAREWRGSPQFWPCWRGTYPFVQLCLLHTNLLRFSSSSRFSPVVKFEPFVTGY